MLKKSGAIISKTISTTPEAAWKVIGAVGGVDKWFAPLIQSCRVEGNKRFCNTEAGVLNEDILEVDHNNRIFRYAIPEQKLIPVENILGKIRVLEAEDNKAAIEWSAAFDVLPERETEAKGMFIGAWTMGIEGLEKYINSSN